MGGFRLAGPEDIDTQEDAVALGEVEAGIADVLHGLGRGREGRDEVRGRDRGRQRAQRQGPREDGLPGVRDGLLEGRGAVGVGEGSLRLCERLLVLVERHSNGKEEKKPIFGKKE